MQPGQGQEWLDVLPGPQCKPPCEMAVPPVHHPHPVVLAEPPGCQGPEPTPYPACPGACAESHLPTPSSQTEDGFWPFLAAPPSPPCFLKGALNIQGPHHCTQHALWTV